MESVRVRADVLARRCLMTRLVCQNYQCVVCGLITQKKRLIDNLFEIVNECHWFLPVCKYILYVQQIANVCVCVRVCVCVCEDENVDMFWSP